MTLSDTSEYAWHQQTAEPSPNMCLITEELSPDTVVQADKNLGYYMNSMIGPPIFPLI